MFIICVRTGELDGLGYVIGLLALSGLMLMVVLFYHMVICAVWCDEWYNHRDPQLHNIHVDSDEDSDEETPLL